MALVSDAIDRLRALVQSADPEGSLSVPTGTLRELFRRTDAGAGTDAAATPADLAALLRRAADELQGR